MEMRTARYPIVVAVAPISWANGGDPRTLFAHQIEMVGAGADVHGADPMTAKLAGKLEYNAATVAALAKWMDDGAKKKPKRYGPKYSKKRIESQATLGIK